MYNYLGQEVRSISVQSSEITLKRDNLSSGLYFVQLTEGNEELATKKLLFE